MAANARRLRGTSRKACSAHRARGAFAAIWEIISARNARLRFRGQWVATCRFGGARGARGSFPRRAQSSWRWIALRGDACSLPPQGSSEALPPRPPPPAWSQISPYVGFRGIGFGGQNVSVAPSIRKSTPRQDGKLSGAGNATVGMDIPPEKMGINERRNGRIGVHLPEVSRSLAPGRFPGPAPQTHAPMPRHLIYFSHNVCASVRPDSCPSESNVRADIFCWLLSFRNVFCSIM